MRPTTSYLYIITFTLLQLIDGARKPESVLLSNVKTLTLRKDLLTTSNRVAAVPQVLIPPSRDSLMSYLVSFLGLLDFLS